MIELLVVIAIIGILAALVLTTVSGAKAKAKRTACTSNLRQINVGLRMYSDEANDRSPRTPNTTNAPPLNKWTGYRKLMMDHVGNQVRLFACPADTFYFEWVHGIYAPDPSYEQTNFDFSSYLFNGGNLNTNAAAGGYYPGIAGRKLSSIREPAKTVLVAESPAWSPYSWHQPSHPPVISFNNALNVVSFVDGHVSYVPIYWDANRRVQSGGHLYPTASAEYDPPAGYDYKWSGD